MVDVGGYRLAAQVRGADAPAVACIAGIGEPGSNWDAVIRAMSRPATIVTYDRAGVGASEPAPNFAMPRPYSHFADELRRLLDGLDMSGPAILVGHSFGCLIARIFAGRHPERVCGLVLVEGSQPQMTLWEGDGTGEADGDRPEATRLDCTSGALEVRPLARSIPAVVLTRTPGRWASPRATAEVDASWRRAHSRLAAELGAPHLFALDGGHRLNVDAPALVALAVDAVIDAAGHRPVRLDPAAVARVGGRIAQ